MSHSRPVGNLLRVLLLGLLVLAVVSTVSAQLGTTNSPFASKAPAVTGVEVHADTTSIYPGADYIAGGVGLRNHLQGGITLSGTPTGPTQDALLYWSVLGPVKPQDGFATVTRLKPGPTASVTVVGDPIAVGPDPCWGSDGNHIYRAHLPTSIVTGTGSYLVTFAAGAGGLSNGEDPFDGNTVFPLMEGAAIVAITTGSNIVTVFDNQAGLLLEAPLSYNLNLLVPTIAGGAMKFTTIGADGQVGFGVNASNGVSREDTWIDNFPPFPKHLAGPSDPQQRDTDASSDWNGNSAAPLPTLFDVTTHGFTLSPGGFNALHVRYTAGGDCANVVANVVSQQF